MYANLFMAHMSLVASLETNKSVYLAVSVCVIKRFHLPFFRSLCVGLISSFIWRFCWRNASRTAR